MSPSVFLNVTKRRIIDSYRLSSKFICPIGFPDTSVTNKQSTLRKIPEELRSYHNETLDSIKDEEFLN
jgi:hypothetical protein